MHEPAFVRRARAGADSRPLSAAGISARYIRGERIAYELELERDPKSALGAAMDMPLQEFEPLFKTGFCPT